MTRRSAAALLLAGWLCGLAPSSAQTAQDQPTIESPEVIAALAALTDKGKMAADLARIDESRRSLAPYRSSSPLTWRLSCKTCTRVWGFLWQNCTEQDHSLTVSYPDIGPYDRAETTIRASFAEANDAADTLARWMQADVPALNQSIETAARGVQEPGGKARIAALAALLAKERKTISDIDRRFLQVAEDNKDIAATLGSVSESARLFNEATQSHLDDLRQQDLKCDARGTVDIVTGARTLDAAYKDQAASLLVASQLGAKLGKNADLVGVRLQTFLSNLGQILGRVETAGSTGSVLALRMAATQWALFAANVEQLRGGVTPATPP